MAAICIGLKDHIKSGGVIINVTSSAAQEGAFAAISYSASKAAVNSLTKSLATGTIDETTSFASSDIRTSIPRFTPEARQANHALVKLLATIAARKGVTSAQIALAWLLAQQLWIVPIPGTRRLERLEENIRAVEVDLTVDELDEIETAASTIKVQGARYPEHLERLTGR